jgi:hypothetical protein
MKMVVHYENSVSILYLLDFYGIEFISNVFLNLTNNCNKYCAPLQEKYRNFSLLLIGYTGK